MLSHDNKISLQALEALQGSEILDFWNAYMSLHHPKVPFEALEVFQGSKIPDFSRAYTFLHHCKESLQALRESKILNFSRVSILLHVYQV